MFGYLARSYILRRLFQSASRSGRHQRGYGGGYYPMARRHRSSGGFFAPPRHRRSQSNVRVFGCCLPGCGVMALVPTLGAWMAGRQAVRAARRR